MCDTVRTSNCDEPIEVEVPGNALSQFMDLTHSRYPPALSTNLEETYALFLFGRKFECTEIEVTIVARLHQVTREDPWLTLYTAASREDIWLARIAIGHMQCCKSVMVDSGRTEGYSNQPVLIAEANLWKNLERLPITWRMEYLRTVYSLNQAHVLSGLQVATYSEWEARAKDFDPERNIVSVRDRVYRKLILVAKVRDPDVFVNVPPM